MSSAENDSRESLVGVAKAVRTRGLKGELVADLLTDFPERFENVESLIALSPGGDRSRVEIEDFWFQNERIILKLRQVDTVEAAQQFVGYEFCVVESERIQLEQDEYYDFELQGCAVRDVSGKHVGTVASVLKTGGVPILVVKTLDGVEVLVPLAESIVVKIDTTRKLLVIDPPEGLLELS